MISAPSNFNHISHMGPGDGIQIQRLMDLPTTLETADSVSNPIISSPLSAPGPPGSATRVKSMIQQSPGGKLPSRLPSASAVHHPQRSISHNEVRNLISGKGLNPVCVTGNLIKFCNLLMIENQLFGLWEIDKFWFEVWHFCLIFSVSKFYSVYAPISTHLMCFRNCKYYRLLVSVY